MKLQPVVLKRFLVALLLVLVVAGGLTARMQRAGADADTISGFLALYLGDTLWAVMFFLLGRLLFPMAQRLWLVVVTLMLTLGLELSQLWQPAFLQWLRGQPVVGFLLGSSFLWSDVVCLFVGVGLAVVLDWGLSVVVRRCGEA